MSTQIIYSEEFKKHDNPGHPENANRLDYMLDELRKTDFYKDLDFVLPEKLPVDILSSVHSEEMIDRIIESSKEEDSWIDLDTYVSKNDFETSLLAAGGVYNACLDVLKGKADNAFCFVRPPGHHATRNRSMGFCLFNNAAIAAKEIAKKGKKVLIIDPDVHHGNGTQDIIYDISNVIYQSLHLSPHFPGTGNISEIGIGEGKGYTNNAPLSYFYGNEAAEQILNDVFIPIANQFKPDLIIMSSGFDSHHSDPLGGLRFTADFFGRIVKKYQEVQEKMVITIEGGYNLDWIGKCAVSQIAQLSDNKIIFSDKTDSKKDVLKLKNSIKKELEDYWEF